MSKHGSKISGVWAAIITPFQNDGTLDLGGVKAIVDYMIDAKLEGVLVAGNTGEFTQLSIDERKLLVKTACEAANGKIKVLASSCAHWTEGTLDYIRYFDSIGLDYHLINPPYDTPTSDQGVVDYSEEVAQAAEAGIVIHNHEGFPGAYLSPELIAKISKISNMAGVKDVAPFEHNSKTLEAVKAAGTHDTFGVVSANERTILAGFSIGLDGTMGVASMVAPKYVKQIYDSIAANDVHTARALQEKIDPVYESVSVTPFPGCLKVGVELLGLSAGAPRRPHALAPAGTKEKLRKVFRQADLI